jgi:DNA-directed RNA polymerase subunit RPC12/RpoP
MILHVVIAVLIGLVILWLGIKALRVASAGGRVPDTPEVEDVDELDVYFVCANCGTEFRVTRLGEAQVPRHCGEKMEVVRRPRSAGADPSMN